MSSMFATPRYRLLDILGEGGMGIVYRAEDRLTGRLVALKQVTFYGNYNEFGSLHASHDLTSMSRESLGLRLALAHEFSVLASLRHPYIVSVLDYGFTEAHQPFYVMELLTNSHTITEATKHADERTKLDYLVQVLQALAYLHRRGVIHRDLKPENILVSEGKARILDFGLSVTAVDLAPSGATVGSLLYMSPEVLEGRPATASSDLYAIGVIAYEMFAGRHPFYTESTIDYFDLVDILLKESIDLNTLSTSSALATVIGTLLNKEPSARFASATEALIALQAAVSIPIAIETSTVRESYLQASRFVGRDAEMNQLERALTLATEGHGSLWLIGGESGIGKSRLVEEFRISALISGAKVLIGQAVQHGSVPYQMWRDIVAHLALTANLSDTALAALQWVHPDIGTVLGRTIPVAIDEQPREERIFGAIYTMFKQQEQPIVLILEDLHWSASDLELLKRFVPTLDNLKILVVGSYRDDEAPALPAELPGGNVIKLGRLAETSLAALVESMLGSVGTQQDIISFLQRETEGNVFFLVEMLRTLAENAGSLAQIDYRVLPTSIFTGGIQKIVERRLTQVTDPDRALLNLAAVLGRSVDLPVMRAVAPERDVERWALHCAEVSILEIKDDQWRFAHDKLREGILKQLDADAQRTLHRLAAETLTSLYGDDASRAGQLAYHWAGADDLDKEYAACIQASTYYLELNLFRDARRLAERALTLSDRHPDDERAMLASVARLVPAYWQLGDYELAKPLIERGLSAATALGDQANFIELSLTLGRILRRQGETSAGQRHLQAGFALAKQIGDQRRVAQALLARITPLMDSDLSEARQIASEALSIYHALGDELGEGHAISRLAMTMTGGSDIEESRRLFTRARDIFLKYNVRSAYVNILQHLISVEISSGNLEEAVRLAEDGLSIAQELGSKVLIGNMLQLLGQCNVHRRQLDQAERYEREAITIFRQLRDVSWLAFAQLNLGYLLFLQGKFDQAQVELEAALDLSRAGNMLELILKSLTNLSLVLVETDDLERASRTLSEAMRVAAEWGVIEDQLTVVEALVTYLLKRGRFTSVVEYSAFLLQQPNASQQIQIDAQNGLHQAKPNLSELEYEQATLRGQTLTYVQLIEDAQL